MASLQGHIPAALTSQQQQPEPRQQRRHSISQGQQPSIHQLYPSSSEYTQTSSHTGSTDSKAGCPQKSRITEINPEWGLTKAGKTRQRLPLACQVCRKKKVILSQGRVNGRFDVPENNLYANIVSAFPCLVYIKRQRREDPEILQERSRQLLVAKNVEHRKLNL